MSYLDDLKLKQLASDVGLKPYGTVTDDEWELELKRNEMSLEKETNSEPDNQEE